ncbi:MAG: NAD(P)/FAD-dependent oxidoreductase [Chloroflexi bacterium]|nr:NAD(P)/FAD-dependent oxidoreductase [Chloroflexota bacterium]
MPRAAVVGAGHNGLVCAAYLGRAGFDVTVLEQADRPGGCVLTEEPVPGFRMNIGAIEIGGIVESGIVDELDLRSLGLRLAAQPEIAVIHTPGPALAFHRSLDATTAHLADALSPAAAAEWARFTALADGVWGLFSLVDDVPPPSFGELARMAQDAYGDRGSRIFEAVLSPADSVLRANLADADLRAAAAAFGAHGEIPPWLPGSGVFAFLLPGGHGGVGARPVGGSGALVDALVMSIERAGGRVRCGAPVARVRLSEVGVAGVTLASGEEVDADVVVSTIDLRRLGAMLPADERTAALRLGGERTHGGLCNVAELKVDLALDGETVLAREAPCDPGALRMLVPDLDVGAAFRAIVDGRIPDPMPVMFSIPSASDRTMAPTGRSVGWVSAFVPAVRADGRTWPEGNDDAVRAALATVERFAPGTTARILGTVVTGPAEWEARTGNPGGNPNHIDLTLDQMLGSRPAAGLARYETPVRGLFLSGAGTHPGGGVTGRPGRNAAVAVTGAGGRGVRRMRAPGLRLADAARGYLRMRGAL